MLSLAPFLGLLIGQAHGADQVAYDKKYGTRVPSADQAQTLDRCLQAWGEEAPWKTSAKLKVRVLSTQVRVMGFGGVEPVDDLHTEHPQLVLIEPSVSVATKTTYKLLNPNGWYCFHTPTTALAVSLVKLACDAHLSSSSDSGVAVIGRDETSTGAGGVVVLGQFRVEKIGCTD
jgi:hypothetical protein